MRGWTGMRTAGSLCAVAAAGLLHASLANAAPGLDRAASSMGCGRACLEPLAARKSAARPRKAPRAQAAPATPGAAGAAAPAKPAAPPVREPGNGGY